MCRWNQDRVRGVGMQRLPKQSSHFLLRTLPRHNIDPRPPLLLVLSSWQFCLPGIVLSPRPTPMPCALQVEILSLHSSPDVGLALGMVTLWPFCAGGSIPTHSLRLPSHLHSIHQPRPLPRKEEGFCRMMLTFSEGCEVDSTLLSFEIGKNFLRQGLTLSLTWHPKEEEKTCNKKNVRMQRISLGKKMFSAPLSSFSVSKSVDWCSSLRM